MVRIFISYSHIDDIFAVRLYNDLSQVTSTWIDLEIVLGKPWDDQIDRVLRPPHTKLFIVLVSENSVASEEVKNEIAAALDRKIEYILPILLDNSEVPYRLLRRNWIDLGKVSYEEALAKIHHLINTIRNEQTTAESPAATTLALHQKRDRFGTSKQNEASQCPDKYIRLIAGPGTGKTFTIELRAHKLLSVGTSTKELVIISFTRNSVKDLKRRIEAHLSEFEVSVRTMHSLALTILHSTQALNYLVNPRVFDPWELTNIFDAEYVHVLGVKPSERAIIIRTAYEGMWETNSWDLVDPVDPPISDQEKSDFLAFHQSTSLVYSAVLPGELNYRLFNMIQVDDHVLQNFKCTHLIVDEYQDLNAVDLSLVRAIADKTGCSLFVVGDDDQSIYSFRYASPSGILDFESLYPESTTFVLDTCFRSTPVILNVAESLITHFSDTRRITKKTRSYFAEPEHYIEGKVHRWRLTDATSEAQALAKSIAKLIANGIAPREIIILLSNVKIQFKQLSAAFDTNGLEYEVPRSVKYSDTPSGRLAYALLRLACDDELTDFLAIRTILGSIHGVGIATVVKIKQAVMEGKFDDYRDIFFRSEAKLDIVFDKKVKTAISKCRGIIYEVLQWSAEDQLGDRKSAINQIIEATLSGKKDYFKDAWLEEANLLPDATSLEQVRDLIGAKDDEEVVAIVKDIEDSTGDSGIYERLFPPKVRIMTMHSVKGLEAQVVFIPGLEQEILPGRYRAKPYQINEGARLLYVAITRAKAACILSYARSREVFGDYIDNRQISIYAYHLDGSFQDNIDGLTERQAREIADTVRQMELTR